MSLPNEPVMLLSYINTLLRDGYSDLQSLTKALNIDIEVINLKLNNIGYFYNKEANQFK